MLVGLKSTVDSEFDPGDDYQITEEADQKNKGEHKVMNLNYIKKLSFSLLIFFYYFIKKLSEDQIPRIKQRLERYKTIEISVKKV